MNDQRQSEVSNVASLEEPQWVGDLGECTADMFRLVCDRSTTGLLVIRSGRIVYANSQAAQIFDRTVNQLRGHSLLQFVHPDDQRELQNLIVHDAPGPLAMGTKLFRIPHDDRKVRWAEISVHRLADTEQAGIAIYLTDVTRSRAVELELDDHLRFERLLADLSAGFINVPATEIDAQIDSSLRLLVDFLGNDRSTLVEFGEDRQVVLVSHSYSTAAFGPFPLGPFPVEKLPWFISQFREGKTVFVRNIETDLPVEAVHEKAYCRAHGIISNVTVPLAASNIVLGGITFAFMQRACDWPPDVLARLSMIGEAFANAILRRNFEVQLHSALADNQKLKEKLEHENEYLRKHVKSKLNGGRIVGSSDSLSSVLHLAECVSRTDATVLLSGETGTGKELLAQWIHEHSSRKDAPMVVINCASLPAALVESELFGREAGAYTGAASAQFGRFRLADESTLFLDEIGEFPIELQAKLLRVLETGIFEPLGSRKSVKVNVRIIAATNRDLAAEVSAGRFRLDLYHRLNVFPIRLPPLRERTEDIPLLVWSFVECFGRRMGKKIESIPDDLMVRLQCYSWPGNVRELSNVIERSIILSSGSQLDVQLPVEDTLDLTDHSAAERERIGRVLKVCGWRIRGVKGAAARLGLKPTTLEARMARLGILRPGKLSESDGGDSILG